MEKILQVLVTSKYVQVTSSNFRIYKPDDKTAVSTAVFLCLQEEPIPLFCEQIIIRCIVTCDSFRAFARNLRTQVAFKFLAIFSSFQGFSVKIFPQDEIVHFSQEKSEIVSIFEHRRFPLLLNEKVTIFCNHCKLILKEK